MAKRDYRKGDLPFGFQVIPKDVLTMPEFQRMPASAKALMLDLMAQYTGKNNGRLCSAFEVMQRDAGWTSKSKLLRAKVALAAMPFAVTTRKGHAPRTVEWVGFTWWKLDWHESMDLGPREFPYLNFARLTPTDPNAGRQTSRRNNSVVPNQGRWSPKSPPGPPESGAMGNQKARPSAPNQGDCKSETPEKFIAPESGDVIDVAISGVPSPVVLSCAPAINGEAPRQRPSGYRGRTDHASMGVGVPTTRH